MTHNNPDPDALASGKALATLFKSLWNIPSRLVYCGLVSRAENRTMLRLLTPEWEFEEPPFALEQYSAIALIDSQPGAGNNSLPADRLPDIIIDHHLPIRPAVIQVPYVDIRTDVGGTVSMVYQYLSAANTPIPTELATAMFYGLRSDTNGLSRGATPVDGIIYVKLLEILDHNLLMQVELAGLSRDYFLAFDRGLQNAEIVGHSVTTFLGEMHRPDLVAEMADLLVRMEEVNAALCMGCFNSTLYFSLRIGPLNEDAGLLVQRIIIPPGKAGGHGSMAGGQIPQSGWGYPTARSRN